MKNCMKKLKDLIENIVLPDVEDYIDEIFEQIANNKNATEKNDQELTEMYEMRDEFKEMLGDIENDTLENEECQELYEEISKMIDDDGELV